jgi:hypothetical protein
MQGSPEPTVVNQYLIMLFALVSPIATFIAVEWRAERKHKWEADALKAEREAVAEKLRLQLESERLERAAVAEVIKAQLEAEAKRLRLTVSDEIQNVSKKNDQLQKAVQENTELTKSGAVAADRAYTEANHLNAKLEAQAALAKQAADALREVQARFDQLLKDRTATASSQIDSIQTVTTDTNERVRGMES